jgi:predicted nucleic acid-binding Zn ribbon protein
MTDNEDDPVDPVLEVLTEYEQKLRILRQNNQLAGEAHRTFGSLVHELERRSGVDRRAQPRPGADRRNVSPHEQTSRP